MQLMLRMLEIFLMFKIQHVIIVFSESLKHSEQNVK